MKFGKFLLICAGILAALSSCKKEEEDETKSYLTGDPYFSIPAYGKAGDTFVIKGQGSVADNGDEVGYYWLATPLITVRDTTDTFTLVLTDTLCTVTVTCYSYSEEYYSNSTSHTITIVNTDREKGSIQGKRLWPDKDFIFVDTRDNKEYWCTTIGDLDWFKENLAYEGAGTPLEGCNVTTPLFGRYYNWEEAKTSCPDGWRLTSNKDWASLAGNTFGNYDSFIGIAGKLMGDVTFNGEDMWEYWPQVKISDQYGLHLMPCGYAIGDEDGGYTFSNFMNYAVLWTSDDKDDELAMYRYIYEEQNDMLIGTAAKDSFMASVRCVRDRK